MTNYRKISYEAPELEVHPITLERGFAASDHWTGGDAEPLAFGFYLPEGEDY